MKSEDFIQRKYMFILNIWIKYIMDMDKIKLMKQTMWIVVPACKKGSYFS